MALANELFDAAELSGIARAELEVLDERTDSLATYLPNEYTFSHTATYHATEGSQQDLARYRAWDAEPERGREQAGAEKAVKLPAVSQTQHIGEESKINMRTRGDDVVRSEIEKVLRKQVTQIYNTVNLQRAHVLVTGRAVVNQKNYKLNDDFGRHGDLTTTATNLWTDPSVSRLEYLQLLAELYADHAGVEPGSILMTKRVLTSLVRGDEFAIELSNGGSRRARQSEALGILSDAGLPPIVVKGGRVGSGQLLPEDRLLMLPAEVGENSPEATELGSTVWGLTATALAEGFNIEESDLPGIVAGVYAPERVPFLHEVFADSVNLPILKQPNLSLVAKVL